MKPTILIILRFIMIVSLHYLPVIVSGVIQSVWVEYLSPEGKLYYYNTITKQTQWVPPTQSEPIPTSTSKSSRYSRPRKPHHYSPKFDAATKVASDEIVEVIPNILPDESTTLTNDNNENLYNQTNDNLEERLEVENCEPVSASDSAIANHGVIEEVDTSSKLDDIPEVNSSEVLDNGQNDPVDIITAPLVLEYIETKNQLEGLIMKLAYHVHLCNDLQALLEEKEARLKTLTHALNLLISRVEEAETYASSLSESNQNLQAELSNLRQEVVDMELHVQDKESGLEESIVSPNPESVRVMVDALTANISTQSQFRAKLESQLKDMDSELRMAYDSIEDLEDRLAALTKKKAVALVHQINTQNVDRSSAAISSFLNQLYYFFLRPLQVGLELSSKTFRKKKRSYRDWMMGIYRYKYKPQYRKRREENVTISDANISTTDDDDLVHEQVDSTEKTISNHSIPEIEKEDFEEMIQDSVSSESLPEDDDVKKKLEDLNGQLSGSMGAVAVLEAENCQLRDNLTALSAVLDSKTESLVDLAAEANSYLAEFNCARDQSNGLKETVAQLLKEKADVAAELEQRESDLKQLDENYREQEEMNRQLAHQLERTLADGESSQQRYQESIFDLSARLQSSEERGQVAEESSAQHSAAAEQLRKDLADALSYQQRLRDQLLNTSLQLADMKRWQAVSLVDGQLRESLIKNETSSRLAAENNQKRCRRKLFGLF